MDVRAIILGVFIDLFAAPFCYEGSTALMAKQWAKAGIAYAIGAPLALLGLSVAGVFTTSITKGVADFVYPVASDVRWWIAILLFALFWIGGAETIAKAKAAWWLLAIIVFVALFPFPSPRPGQVIGYLNDFGTGAVVSPPSTATAVQSTPTPSHVPRLTARWGDFSSIQPLDLEGSLMRGKQPCVLKLSAVQEQMNFRNVIATIATRNSVCTVVDNDADQNPAMRDIDSPPTPTPPAGLSIRWNKDTQPQGESVAQWFEGEGFIVNRGHSLPPNSAPTEIWIDFGPGSPWRAP